MICDVIHEQDIAAPKQRPIAFSPEMVRAILAGRKTATRRLISPRPRSASSLPICRYGSPGEQLWVRERFAPLSDQQRIIYSADEPPSSAEIRWRPAMFMPRSASRILMQIDSVQPCRLCCMTVQDAITEGFDAAGPISDPLAWFADLWDSLTTDPATRWRKNPWVWVIRFQVVHPHPSASML